MTTLTLRHTAVVLAMPAVAMSDPVSTGFDGSPEGWTPGPSTAVQHAATGGHPGGYLAVVDDGNVRDMSILAPSAFLGDLGSLDGGLLSFDLRIIARDPQQPGYIGRFGTVVLSGPSGTAQRDLVTADPSETEWLRYTAPLTATVWGKTPAAWAALLADIDTILIEAESTVGDETVGFDNISLGCRTAPLAIASGFDGGADGWTAGVSTLVAQVPADGNPGGYLAVTDNGGIQDMTIVAPVVYRGDLRAFDGGTLSFDSRIVSRVPNQPGFLGTFGTVWIFGSSGSAQRDLITTEPSELDWVNYGAPFTAAAWNKTDADWDALLADVTGIVVAAESTIGDEVIGYDNFAIAAAVLADRDCDGVLDATDNCIALPNPAQADSNGDGFGNACDPDIGSAAGPGNDDCLVNFSDLGLLKTAFFAMPGAPNWNADADFAGSVGGEPDGVINFADLGRMKTFFFGAPGPSAATTCP